MGVGRLFALHARILNASGFGRIVAPPFVPFDGPVGSIQVRPLDAEQGDLGALLARLESTYGFCYGRDQLILRYEYSRLTLIEITFMAG